MELEEVLLKRRSIRKFSEKEISDEDIDALMHAAMSGPSACNRRPWEFYVVKDKETIKKLHDAAHYSKITAPLAIVVAGNLSKALPLKMSEYWIQDCSAATENILLKAVDIGLGAVWCGIYPQKRAEKKVADAIGLQDGQIPLNIIYIGYAEEFPENRDQYDPKCVHYI